MEIKLIATDVDGTLMADDHLTIPSLNKQSLIRAKEKNIKIAVCTGRTYSLTDRECAALGCVDYLILSNGAVVMDAKTLGTLYSCYLPVQAVEKILKAFEKYPIIYEIYADRHAYVTKYSYDHFLEAEGLPEIFLRDYRKRMFVKESVWDIVRGKNVEKINVNHIPEECIAPLREELNTIPNLVYSVAYLGNMEITAKGADKGRALKWLAEYLKTGIENVMAFGDSGNDITMLECAGYSYAMKNGSDKAKKAAKFVTGSDNSEGGVGETIKKNIL